MAKSEIDADAVTPEDLFYQEKLFQAPVFQRYYVWKT